MIIADARGVLQGDGITKRARWLTYAPEDTIDEASSAVEPSASMDATRPSRSDGTRS